MWCNNLYEPEPLFISIKTFQICSGVILTADEKMEKELAD